MAYVYRQGLESGSRFVGMFLAIDEADQEDRQYSLIPEVAGVPWHRTEIQ